MVMNAKQTAVLSCDDATATVETVDDDAPGAILPGKAAPLLTTILPISG